MPRLKTQTKAVELRGPRAAGGRRGRSGGVRRRAAPRWLRPALRTGALGALLLILAGTGVWLWHSGRIARTAEAVTAHLIDLSGRWGLRVEEVLVEGREQSEPYEVLGALSVRQGQPILGLDLDRARADLEALPWVAAAVVERRLPGTLFVRLRERQPLALWQHRQTLRVIDDKGAVLKGQRIGRFADLPIVVGANAPANAPVLLGLLERYPALAARVEAALWVGDRRWDLRLDNGVAVRLPEGDLLPALERLAAAAADAALLDRNIVAVDLRLPERLVVQKAATVYPRRKVKGDHL